MKEKEEKPTEEGVKWRLRAIKLEVVEREEEIKVLEEFWLRGSKCHDLAGSKADRDTDKRRENVLEELNDLKRGLKKLKKEQKEQKEQERKVLPPQRHICSQIYPI